MFVNKTLKENTFYLLQSNGEFYSVPLKNSIEEIAAGARPDFTHHDKIELKNKQGDLIFLLKDFYFMRANGQYRHIIFYHVARNENMIMPYVFSNNDQIIDENNRFVEV